MPERRMHHADVALARAIRPDAASLPLSADGAAYDDECEEGYDESDAPDGGPTTPQRVGSSPLASPSASPQRGRPWLGHSPAEHAELMRAVGEATAAGNHKSGVGGYEDRVKEGVRVLRLLKCDGRVPPLRKPPAPPLISPQEREEKEAQLMAKVGSNSNRHPSPSPSPIHSDARPQRTPHARSAHHARRQHRAPSYAGSGQHALHPRTVARSHSRTLPCAHPPAFSRVHTRCRARGRLKTPSSPLARAPPAHALSRRSCHRVRSDRLRLVRSSKSSARSRRVRLASSSTPRIRPVRVRVIMRLPRLQHRHRRPRRALGGRRSPPAERRRPRIALSAPPHETSPRLVACLPPRAARRPRSDPRARRPRSAQSAAVTRGCRAQQVRPPRARGGPPSSSRCRSRSDSTFRGALGAGSYRGTGIPHRCGACLCKGAGRSIAPAGAASSWVRRAAVAA